MNLSYFSQLFMNGVNGIMGIHCASLRCKPRARSLGGK
jgi:hypothetical protein